MKMDIHAKDQKRRRERVEKVKKLRTRQEVMKPTRNRSENDPFRTRADDNGG